MWSKLADELLDHPKVSEAARLLGGRNGRVIAIGFYAMSLMHTNKHLTDGVLSIAVIDGFSSHVANPTAIADAFVRAGLFDKHEAGYRIHDFRDHNQSAADIKRRRREDRERKRESRRGNGHA